MGIGRIRCKHGCSHATRSGAINQQQLVVAGFTNKNKTGNISDAVAHHDACLVGSRQSVLTFYARDKITIGRLIGKIDLKYITIASESGTRSCDRPCFFLFGNGSITSTVLQPARRPDLHYTIASGLDRDCCRRWY